MPGHRSCFELVEKINKIMSKIISIRSKPVMVGMIGLSSVLTVPVKKPDVGSVNIKELSTCVIAFREYDRSRKTINRISAKASC